jgi:hypothetical protein
MFPRVQPENFISVLEVVGFMMKLPPALQVDWVRGQHCPLREQPLVHYNVSGINADPRGHTSWIAPKLASTEFRTKTACSPMTDLVGDETPLGLGRGGDAGAGYVRARLLGC